MATFEPYSYQKNVAELILAGQSVILQAPTGAGKTAASLLPYLHAQRHRTEVHFPRKCVYSVPMRVLAKQFEYEYRSLLIRNGWDDRLTVTIQTGERPEDRQFEGDLIFCTIDQSLSSLIAGSYALSGSKRHLNAGAVIGSYLVFDEYHLFPTTQTAGPGALGATLTMLQLLNGIVPFCLMTATFSETMLAELAQLLNAQVVTVSDDELVKIETGDDAKPRKTRRFHMVDTPISAGAVLSSLKAAQRVIAVCNRVDRAQALYQDLCGELGQERVILLHSRFLKKDRNALEQRVLKEFGKDSSQHSPEKMVLVATQVVEVGLDLSCDVLHTEVAPANAIIQRAGRCARRPGEQGTVFIHPLPEDSKRPALPYNEALCTETLDAFTEYDGQVIRFQEEQVIINRVHNKSDQALLDSLRSRKTDTIKSIQDVMMQGAMEGRADLIRKIDNRVLLVHDQPEILGNPLACEGFSLSRGTLKGKWEILEAWADEKGLDWALHYPRELEPQNLGQDEPGYQWQPVIDESLLDLPLPFAVHPQLVAYDNRLGFRFDPSGSDFKTEPPDDSRSTKDKGAFTYQLEDYPAHISAMNRVYRRDLREGLSYMAQRLENRLDLKPGAIERAIRLVIALHDLGKLDSTWQQWAHNYQAGIGMAVASDFMVAHTHSQTSDHQTAARKIKPKRPHHAGEGAVAAIKILEAAALKWANTQQGAQVLAKAMLTAIARHHNANTKGFDRYQIHPAAAKAIEQALDAVNLTGLAVVLQPCPSIQLFKYLVRIGDDWPNWFLYFVLVRNLILADHQSLAEQNQR